MLMSEKLQVLRHMPIVPISKEVLYEMRNDPDFYELAWYRHLDIVPPVEGEVGCHLRSMSRYVLLEEAS